MPHASRSVGRDGRRAARAGGRRRSGGFAGVGGRSPAGRSSPSTAPRFPARPTIVNFPVLVSITDDANLKTTANGGFVTSAKGHDILFQGEDATTCAPAGAPCRLDHEIESYDGVNGHARRLGARPDVCGTAAAAANTVIYLYYGDATITCSQQNKTGVWDASYREVFHLHESGDHTDSTKNAFTAVGKGAVTNGAAGQIGPAVDLASGATGHDAGAAQRLRRHAADHHQLHLRGLGELPHLRRRAVRRLRHQGPRVPELRRRPGCRRRLLHRGARAGTGSGLYKLPDGSATTVLLRLGVRRRACKAARLSNLDDPGAGRQPGQWYHVAGTFDVATSTRRLLVNGAQVVTDTASAPASRPTSRTTPGSGIDNLQNDYLDGHARRGPGLVRRPLQRLDHDRATTTRAPRGRSTPRRRPGGLLDGGRHGLPLPQPLRGRAGHLLPAVDREHRPPTRRAAAPAPRSTARRW